MESQDPQGGDIQPGPVTWVSGGGPEKLVPVLMVILSQLTSVMFNRSV